MEEQYEAPAGVVVGSLLELTADKPGSLPDFTGGTPTNDGAFPSDFEFPLP